MSDHMYFASYYRWLVASQRLGIDLTSPRILDVGCDDANFLVLSSGALRVGVDLAPRVQASDGMQIVRANATQLPMLNRSFNSILAFDVLEHIDDDRAVMREMLRVLSPGGTIWFSTPARHSAIWPSYLQPYANRSFGHVRNGYTLDEIRALLPVDPEWQLCAWYWNETLLRVSFLPLHMLDQIAPSVSHWLTRICFQIDSSLPPVESLRGHLFGRISRSESRT